MKSTMKISYSEIIRAISCIAIVCNIGILRAFSFEMFTSGYSLRYLTVLITIFVIPLTKFNNRYWNRSVIAIELFMVLELFISTLRYDQSIGNITRQNIHVFYYLLVLPLICVNERSFRRIVKFLVIVTVLTLVLKTASWYSYNFRATELFPFLANEFGENWIRNNKYRYSSTAFGSLVFMLCCFLIVMRRKQQKRLIVLLEILTLAFIIFFDVAVYQARSEVIICVVEFLAVYLLNKKDKVEKKILKYSVVIVTVFGILISGMLDTFFSSFKITNKLGGGTIRLRLEALAYYGNLLKNSAISGVGFFDTTNPSTLAVFRGPMGNRYLDDLGIIGFIFQFGLFGIIILTLMIYRMIKIYKNAKDKYQKTLIGGCFVSFVLMSILGACPFDSQRMISIPIFIAFFEHLNKGEVIL